MDYLKKFLQLSVSIFSISNSEVWEGGESISLTKCLKKILSENDKKRQLMQYN